MCDDRDIVKGRVIHETRLYYVILARTKTVIRLGASQARGRQARCLKVRAIIMESMSRSEGRKDCDSNEAYPSLGRRLP